MSAQDSVMQLPQIRFPGPTHSRDLGYIFAPTAVAYQREEFGRSVVSTLKRVYVMIAYGRRSSNRYPTPKNPATFNLLKHRALPYELRAKT